MKAPKKITPARAAAGAGAGEVKPRCGTQGEEYSTDPQPATEQDFDSDTPRAVMAYVANRVIYVVDAELRVLAFGRLVRELGE